MKTYITRVNGLSMKNPMQYRQSMLLDIARQLGWMEMGIYRYPAEREEAGKRSSRLDGIIAGINMGDLVVVQLPTGNGMAFERELADHISVYGARVAFFLHDAESLVREGSRPMLREAVNLYNLAEVLIVPSYEMKQFLLDHGVCQTMKFVVQEMWDYTVNDRFLHTPSFRKEIHYADDEGFGEMDRWKYGIPLRVYGAMAKQGENMQRADLDPDEALSELAGGGFGLVWYQNADRLSSMAYGISFALSRYLAAGIPVIVPAGISNQRVIEENHLGMVVPSLAEAARRIGAMSGAQYQGYVRSVAGFAPALRAGYYTRKCLIDTVQAFYRQDAGKIPIPSREYSLGECTFSTSVLKESYGGGLVLSWEFRGKAEGFLICDTSRRRIYETKNMLQHYLRIEGCRKEAGFIVKAYIETLKGRLIVAESVPAYVYAESCRKPEVSLVIPVCNGEGSIDRCIDTALAQSFPDLEIIVVDDGSTDHTSAILEWYARKYPNIQAVHQENRGIPAARNTGIKRAGGRYIGFMESHDMLRPDMIGSLFRAIESNDCDIACTSGYEIHKDGYRECMQYPMKEDTAVALEAFLQMNLEEEGTWVVNIWNKLYRAALVKDHLFPEITGDDEAWTPYILSYAGRICYRNDLSYEHDRTVCDNQRIRQWTNRSKEELFRIYLKTVLFYLENANPHRIPLLKQLARKGVYEWGRVYEYADYEKLWEKIDKLYG